MPLLPLAKARLAYQGRGRCTGLHGQTEHARAALIHASHEHSVCGMQMGVGVGASHLLCQILWRERHLLACALRCECEGVSCG